MKESEKITMDDMIKPFVQTNKKLNNLTADIYQPRGKTYADFVKTLKLESGEDCQPPMLGGGDFSVSADKKKNTTVQGLTKNPEYNIPGVQGQNCSEPLITTNSGEEPAQYQSLADVVRSVFKEYNIQPAAQPAPEESLRDAASLTDTTTSETKETGKDGEKIPETVL